jgi:triosephosphate isomerase (TIM)
MNEIIVANWKMNIDQEESTALVTELLSQVGNITAHVIVCPSFPALQACSELLANSIISLGAQNIHHQEKGAYTGEVSARMVSSLVKYAIVGHSERRAMGETDEMVNGKIKQAQSYGITPIVCIGESAHDYETGASKEVIANQLNAALHGIELSEGGDVLVAYEPVWAISTSSNATPASPEYAGEIATHIRQMVVERYNTEIAMHLPILYGGSVDSANIQAFTDQADINGALAGGSSTTIETFLPMITK